MARVGRGVLPQLHRGSAVHHDKVKPPVTIEIPAPEVVLIQDGRVTRMLAAQIIAELSKTPEGRALLEQMDAMSALTVAITQAGSGVSGVVTTTPTSSSFSQGGGGTASKK